MPHPGGSSLAKSELRPRGTCPQTRSRSDPGRSRSRRSRRRPTGRRLHPSRERVLLIHVNSVARKRYVSIAALVFIGVALLALLGESAAEAALTVAACVVVGLLSAVFLVRPWLRHLDRQARRKEDGATGPLGGDSARSSALELPTSTDEAHRAVLDVLREYPRVKTIDDKGTMVRAHTTTSVASFGERIVVWMRPVSGSRTRIEIESRPRVPTTLIDYGTNKRNVERLRRALLAYGDVHT